MSRRNPNGPIERAYGRRSPAYAGYRTDRERATAHPFPGRRERKRLRVQRTAARHISFAHGGKRTS